MQGDAVQVPVGATVVTSDCVLLPSCSSAIRLSGSMVAVRLSVLGAPCSTMTDTVITVLPPPGRSPTQSTRWLASGPEQTNPFDPAALRNVTPVGGTSIRTCGRFAGSVASVPPLTATIV